MLSKLLCLLLSSVVFCFDIPVPLAFFIPRIGEREKNLHFSLYLVYGSSVAEIFIGVLNA